MEREQVAGGFDSAFGEDADDHAFAQGAEGLAGGGQVMAGAIHVDRAGGAE